MSRRRLILRALCLALLLGLGIQIVYAVVVLWVCTVGDQLIPSRSVYESVRYLADGTPFIVTYDPTDYYSMSGRTLDGKPIDREDLDDLAYGLDLAGPRRPRYVPSGWAGRIRSYHDGRDPAVYWYLVHTGERDGHAHFVGYDSKLKLLVGYIGAGGFTREKPPLEESFVVNGRRIASGADVASSSYSYYGATEPYYNRQSLGRHEPMQTWLVYVLSGNRVLEIDLHERSVRTAVEAEGIVSIGVSDRLFPMPEEEETMRPVRRTKYLAIRCRDRVQVVDPQGEDRRTYVLLEELRAKELTFVERSDGTAIYESRRRPNRSPVDLHWVRDSEETVRSETVALEETPAVVLLDYANIVLKGPRGIEDPRIISGLFSLLSPVPSAWIAAGAVGVPVAYVNSGEAPSYPSALARSLCDIWPGILISVVLSAGATWLCVKRQGQYAAPWTRTWAVFVFLLGIPGLLGYLFCRSWPVREECPACRETAPRDRESCSCCDADFPEPAPKGIEVLA